MANEITTENKNERQSSTITLDENTVKSIGDSLVDWQREKNKGETESIQIQLPFQGREQLLKYGILILVLVLAFLFAVLKLIESQYVVNIIFAVLGYILGNSQYQLLSKKSVREK